jgi:hypothetical protein
MSTRAPIGRTAYVDTCSARPNGLLERLLRSSRFECRRRTRLRVDSDCRPSPRRRGPWRSSDPRSRTTPMLVARVGLGKNSSENLVKNIHSGIMAPRNPRGASTPRRQHVRSSPRQNNLRRPWRSRLFAGVRFINTREQFMWMREPDLVASSRADRAVGREALDS